MSHLGLEYVQPRMVAASRYFSFNVKSQGSAYDVTGFDLAYAFQSTSLEPFTVDGREYTLRYDDEESEFELATGDSAIISLGVGPMFERATAYRIEYPNTAYALPQDVLRIEAENQSVRARLYIRSMSGTENDDGHNVTGMGGTLYLDFKPPL